MLIEFGRTNLIDKERKQPEEVKMLLEKVNMDGTAATYGSVKNKFSWPFPLVDLRIVDEDIRAQPQDGKTTVEVVVARAPWITAEYAKNPRATPALWRGCIMHTGEVGHID